MVTVDPSASLKQHILIGLMHIIETLHGNTVVLAVQGRLDAVSVPKFKAVIKGHLDSGKTHFVADMCALKFIDSSGLGMLALTLRHAVELGGDIKICGLSPEMQMLFALTRLNKIGRAHV